MLLHIHLAYILYTEYFVTGATLLQRIATPSFMKTDPTSPATYVKKGIISGNADETARRCLTLYMVKL